MMVPVIVCTLGGPQVDVLKASFKAYAPDTELIIHHVERSTFGESYNKAMTEAFEKYDEIIIANDDIVINPSSIPNLLKDVEELKGYDGIDKIGFVAAMADNVRLSQSIRYPAFGNEDRLENSKWSSEQVIREVPLIAPIFAWISKEAFAVAQFPPTNWWSDDIICDDLINAGFHHFVSTSYVHHVGSVSVGVDYEKQTQEALPWLKANRPQYVDEYGRRRGRPL